MSWFWEDKEYFGNQFMTIIEPDITMRAAKRQTMFSVDGDLGLYNTQFWKWKFSYRKRYSETRMIKYGYKPESYGTIDSKITPALEVFMLEKDPLYNHTSSIIVKFADLYSVLIDYLQWNGYEYSIKKEELIIDGTSYYYESVGFLENPDPAEPDNYNIGVGIFKSEDGSIENIQFPNKFNGVEPVIIMYYREEIVTISTEIYIYIDYQSNVPVHGQVVNDMVMSAIVPIKEQGQVLEETTNMKKMLRRMGVSLDDFDEMLTEQSDVEDSTESEAIDNAYILNALSMRNPYEIVPRTYSAEEASDELSAAFIHKLHKENFYSDPWAEEDINQTPFFVPDKGDQGVYEVTAEFAKEWYDDHLREQAYLARSLFKTFAYYSNGIDMGIYNNQLKSIFYIGDSIADRSSVNMDEQVLKEKSISGGLLGVMFLNRLSRDTEITVKSGGMHGSVKFNMTIKTIDGTVRGNEGITDKRSQGTFHFSGTTVSKEDDEQHRNRFQTYDAEGYDKITIRVQKNETQYQEMIVTGYISSFGFTDKTFYTTAGYNKNESRILLPHFILQDIKFTEYVTVNEHSFAAYVYMKVVVEFDWSSFIWTAVFAVASCFVAGCAGFAAFATAVVQAVVIQAIMLQLAEIINNDYLLMALKIAYTVFKMMSGNIDLSSMTTENFLPLALQVATTAYAVHKIKEAEAEADMEKHEKYIEGLEKREENIDEMNTIHPKMELGAHYSFKETNDPDAYYNSVFNSMYGYEQYYDVDGQIELRKQVKSG